MRPFTRNRWSRIAAPWTARRCLSFAVPDLVLFLGAIALVALGTFILLGNFRTGSESIALVSQNVSSLSLKPHGHGLVVVDKKAASGKRAGTPKRTYRRKRRKRRRKGKLRVRHLNGTRTTRTRSFRAKKLAIATGLRVPWKLDAVRYLDAVTDLELLRRNTTEKNVRFPDYAAGTMPSFEKCSAWAGWAFVNAWRENSFDLCEEANEGVGPSIGGSSQPIPPSSVEVNHFLPPDKDPARLKARRRRIVGDGRPTTDQLWREYLAAQLAKKDGEGPSGPPKNPGELFQDEAWSGRNSTFFKRPVPVPQSQGRPSIRCMQRSDVDPGHHLTLCTALPGTTLLLPQGSFPITKCYLDRRDGHSGCNFGWGEPSSTGVFPRGSVIAPGCTVSGSTMDRFRMVAGVSRKFALSIADSQGINVAAMAPATVAPSDVTETYQGKGSVAAPLEGRNESEIFMPPVNETTRHGVWELAKRKRRAKTSKKQGKKGHARKHRKAYAVFDETRFDKMPESVNECRHIVQEPIWFVERLDPLNIYHASEDHSHVFDSLLLLPEEIVLALSNHSLRVVFVDPQQDGPFMDFWKRISYPNKPRFMHKDPYPPGTCFMGGAIWSMHSERSLLSLGLHGQGWRGYGTGCPSLLLHGFNRWIRDLFADRTHTQAESAVWSLAPFSPGSRIPDMTLFNYRDEAANANKALVQKARIKWFMDRETRSIMNIKHKQQKHQRHTMVWLSRRTHEATSQKLTSWQSARVISAPVEECNFQRLWRLALYRNSRQCIRTTPPAEQEQKCKGVVDHFWDVLNLESSDITFPEQIEVVAHADIIIGVHGAALTHAIHMRPGAAVVELAMGGNPHYEFMVKGMNQHYFAAPLNAGNLDNMLPTVMRAMRWIEGVESWADGDKFSDMGCDKLGL